MPEWWRNALGLAVGLGLALLLSGAITVRAILLFVLTNVALDLWMASAD
jgi:hypothetical protein